MVGTAPVAEISPLASLSMAHAVLAQIIAPATPEAVVLLADIQSVYGIMTANQVARRWCAAPCRSYRAGAGSRSDAVSYASREMVLSLTL